MRQMLFVALAVVALMLVLIWAGQRRVIYFPFGGTPRPADYGMPDAEAVTIRTADGVDLGAWFIPAAAPATGFTVIVFNGNAGHRGFRVPLARALSARGIATLLLDYRGFGGNPGSPSETGLMQDARAARAWLDARRGVARDRIVYFGESLGSGVAVQLAAEQPPAAVIVRSPYTSLADIGRLHYPFLPVGLLLRDRFSAIDAVRRVHVPVLVIAGERDSIIPASNSERLFAAAHEPKRLEIIPGADHNDAALLSGERVIDAIVRFLADSSKF
jgi:fermentation-respiration switch protein FrsA (DUF1100 family)